eukprot:27425-Eustigmatos_ZCMA.PRE.1
MVQHGGDVCSAIERSRAIHGADDEGHAMVVAILNEHGVDPLASNANDDEARDLALHPVVDLH